jgi:methylglutaconyl-CoA hydratase
MPDLVTLSLAGRTATLALNRPEARNSLSPELLASVHRRLDELEALAGVTVLVLTGSGKAFCAGMDLKLVLSDPIAAGSLLSSFSTLLLRLRRAPMVVLAKVNGAAIGGGCGMAAACDLAITHADSKMGFPEVDLGVCPAVVAPWLVRKIGAGRARRILLSGGLLTGQQAHAQGIVDHVVPGLAELDAAAEAIAARLATGGAEATRATKRLLNELDGSLDEQVAVRSAALSAEVLRAPESRAMLMARLKP